jgi:hypothetical protein
MFEKYKSQRPRGLDKVRIGDTYMYLSKKAQDKLKDVKRVDVYIDERAKVLKVVPHERGRRLWPLI